jgi:hypothetical protein
MTPLPRRDRSAAAISGGDVPSSHQDNHGQTPAAWTTVTIVMVAFVVGAVGILISTPWVFWVGVGLVVLAVIVGKVMSMMGLGDDEVQPESGRP